MIAAPPDGIADTPLVTQFVDWVEERNPTGKFFNPTHTTSEVWNIFRPLLPNQALQLTAGIFGFMKVFGVVMGFGLSSVFRQTPAATELRSFDGAHYERS